MTKQAAKSSFLSSVGALFRSRDLLNFKYIRWPYLKYMLIFPLAPVFANMQAGLFSGSAGWLGLDAMTLMGSAYCVGAGLLFGLTNLTNMAKASRLFAWLTALSYVAWLVLGDHPLCLAAAVMCLFSLGSCAACAAFAYTFVLNNTERFLGAVAISLFFSLNQLMYGLGLYRGLFSRTYLTSLIIGSCACLMLYRKDDFLDIAGRPKASLNPALQLTLYFFVAHYIVEIFYTYLPGAASSGALIANGAVGLLVVLLALGLQFITRRSIWNMANLFFIAMIITYALYFVPPGSPARAAARFIHGFEQMGYIAAYYLLGCVFKKHGDFAIFKLCLVIILPLSMLVYLIPGAIVASAPDWLPLVATVTSSGLFIGFILLSPAYSRHLFMADWSDDFSRIDMDQTVDTIEQSDQLENLGLSPREKQVAALLLHGAVTKQIAEELGISVNTANFHIKNLYKKLAINSRTELFARFHPANRSNRFSA